jgi:hypothetical protein
VNGDTASAVNGAASLTTAATTASPVGSYAINTAQGTLSAANYTFICVGNTLIVTPAVLTVTANPATKTYGSANPTLTDTITGFVNGDTTGVVSGAAVLTTSAVASSPCGTYPITVGQGTLSAVNYTFTCVNGTLTVMPASAVGNAGIIVLSPSAGGALTMTGNGGIQVIGGNVQVDSNSKSALQMTGNGNITANNINIVGGDSFTGNAGVTGKLTTGAPTVADPLASVPQPQEGTNLGTVTLTGNGSQTLSPGYYSGGITMTGNGALTLNPGVYMLGGAGINLTGNGSLTANGVMLFVTGTGKVNLTGNGAVNITPADSGNYQGISIFQDRSDSAGATLTGNGNMSIGGVLYMSDSALTLTGNGASLGSEIIANKLTMTGNGNITVDDVHDMSASTLFWANLGQTLIQNFNVTGSVTSPTALGNWLATNFVNLYGANSANNLAGDTNSQVAAFFMQLYNNPAQKAAAAVLATALNVYATTTSLGGTAAAAYGFTVTDAGLGATSLNVGSYGAAFGVANNSTLTVWNLLTATNALSNTGTLYNSLSSLLTEAFNMYTAINGDGGIV